MKIEILSKVMLVFCLLSFLGIYLHGVDFRNIFVTGHIMGEAITLWYANASAFLLTVNYSSATGGIRENRGIFSINPQNFAKLSMWTFYGSEDCISIETRRLLISPCLGFRDIYVEI